jgi:hypothetical protein
MATQQRESPGGGEREGEIEREGGGAGGHTQSDTWPNSIYSAKKLYKCYHRCLELGRMDNHSPVGISLQIRDEWGCTSLWSTLQITGLFSHGVYTPTAEKCDVEHICLHSVRLLRDRSFGYPEHSNWQRGDTVLISPALLTPPNKQTNKQTNFELLHLF